MNSRNPRAQLGVPDEVPVQSCDWCGKLTSKWLVEVARDYGDSLYYCSQECEDSNNYDYQMWGEDMGDLEDQYGTRGNTL
jgi:hypothetical protein